MGKRSISLFLIIIWRLLLAGIIAVSFSGCWSWREIDKLGIISGMAIDFDQKTNRSLLTIQVIKPGELGAPGGKGGSKGGGGTPTQPAAIYKSAGRTIFEAVRSLGSQTSRKLYFAHIQVIIIGEAAARQGMRRFLDFFIKDHEPRPLVWLIIAKGEASKLLETPGNQEKLSAMEISEVIANEGTASQAATVSLQEFIGYLLSKSRAPVAPYLEVMEHDGQKHFEITGTAIFQEDKMIGNLDKNAGRGLLWVTGRVKSGVISIKPPGFPEYAALEIIHTGSQVKSGAQNPLAVTVNINVECVFNEQSGTGDLATPQNLIKMRKKVETSVKNSICQAFERARQLRADIFGFGEVIHRRFPKEWPGLENEWAVRFPDIQLTVKVKANIPLTGKIIKPLYPE
jgi:spore germination protein KC